VTLMDMITIEDHIFLLDVYILKMIAYAVCWKTMRTMNNVDYG
jgi:hypothetical protein